MQINSLKKTQYQPTTAMGSQPAFRGGGIDLDTLRTKQDEFRRMSESTPEGGGIIGNFSKIATKAMGVAIAFTATKLCLGKAGELVTSKLSEFAGKIVQKAGDTSKFAKVIDVIKKSNADKYIINIVSAGSALGIAMKDFGLVKKQVSYDTEHLADRVVDSSTQNRYNGSEDFSVNDDVFK